MDGDLEILVKAIDLLLRKIYYTNVRTISENI